MLGILLSNRETGRDHVLGPLKPSVGERCFNHPEFLISEWALESGNGYPVSELGTGSIILEQAF